MATPQGFLDINNEVDTSPDAESEPGVNDILTAVAPQVSNSVASVRFGSTPVNPGQCVKLIDSDPSRTRSLIGVSALSSTVTATTLAYLSDRPLDGSRAGALAFLAAVEVPVINSGSDYLEIRATSELFVTVPATATAPVYVSFITESFSAA